MQTVFETDNYKLLHDKLMGVCRFMRKSDDALTLMETGQECEDTVRSVKVRALHYGEGYAERFDSIAEVQEFEDCNVGCLEGMSCPKCGDMGPFDISASSVFLVDDTGADEFQDVEWQEDSSCACRQCGHGATVAEFRLDYEPHQFIEVQGRLDPAPVQLKIPADKTKAYVVLKCIELADKTGNIEKWMRVNGFHKSDLQAVPIERVAERAETILTAYMTETGDDKEDAIADLLADLMHYCKESNGAFDFETELERAQNFFEEENKEESNG